MSSPASSTDSIRVRLLSDGLEIGARHPVLSVVVTRVLGRIPAARVELVDGDDVGAGFPLSGEGSLAPGRSLEIVAGYGDREERLFRGLVVRHAVSTRRSGRCTLVVECRDVVVKATAARRSALYSDSTDADILSGLLQRYGLKTRVDDTAVVHAQMMQVDATDWDFLLERAEANGLVVRVEDGDVWVERPNTSGAAAMHLGPRSELYEVDLETDARLQLAGASGEAWDAGGQETLVGEADEPAFATPGTQSAGELAAVLGAGPVTLRHGGGLTAEELRAWAGGRLLRSRMALVRGRVRCQGDPRFKPGLLVELEGVGRRFSGKAYVSGVRHELTPGRWETDVQFGPGAEAPREGTAIEAPAAAGLVPASHGLQIGVVTQLADDPQGEERIQVRLPLLAPGGAGVWARLALLDAGDGRGSVFRPEVGDEVVIGFLHQDPRHPVVLGMLHSSAKPSPLPASDDNHKKGFITRSGIELVFDDDKQEVRMTTPKGNALLLSDDAEGLTLTDSSGNSVELSPDGIVIRSAGSLTLAADGEVTIKGKSIALDGQNEVSVKAQEIAVTGQGDVSMKGADVQIEGQGEVGLKGAGVKVEGQGEVGVKGLTLKLEASTQLQAKGELSVEVTSSALAVLKGALVQIN